MFLSNGMKGLVPIPEDPEVIDYFKSTSHMLLLIKYGGKQTDMLYNTYKQMQLF